MFVLYKTGYNWLGNRVHGLTGTGHEPQACRTVAASAPSGEADTALKRTSYLGTGPELF